MQPVRFFLEAACKQLNCAGERICGDNFIIRRSCDSRRTIVVLSDGMGHGVKASILSTLTSSMMLNFTSSREDLVRMAGMVIKTLPICSVRKIGYSTFTIVDFDNVTGRVLIAEHDNPRVMLLRGGALSDAQWQVTTIPRDGGMSLSVRNTEILLDDGDRLVFCTDGVTQSGQQSRSYRFGWGEANLRAFVEYLVSFNGDISSGDLAMQIISKACRNDVSKPADDMSCVALKVRSLRRLLLVSCPPSSRFALPEMIRRIEEADGRRVVCGYPVTEIIAREMGLTIIRGEVSVDPALPPAWGMAPFDLVTEGIVTLTRVLDMLERHEETDNSGAALDLYRMLIYSDEIEFVIGMRRNTDTDGLLPDELELRRDVLRRIASTLERKYNKQVSASYL